MVCEGVPADAPAGCGAAIEGMDQRRLPGGETPIASEASTKRSASVERQILHFFGGDRLADRSVFGVDQRHVGRDFDRLRGVADFERDIDHRVIARADVNGLADELFKARGFHSDLIVAGQQEGRGVTAVGVGLRLDLGAGV